MSELDFGSITVGPVPETSDPHIQRATPDDLSGEDPFSSSSDELQRSYANTDIAVKTKVFNLSGEIGALEYSELKAQSVRDMFEMKGFDTLKKVQIIREETMFLQKSGDYLCAVTWAEYTGGIASEDEEDSLEECPGA